MLRDGMDGSAVATLLDCLAQASSGTKDIRLAGTVYYLWRYHQLNREQILAACEKTRAILDEQSRVDDYDILSDIMDYIVGWCSPHVDLSGMFGRKPANLSLN